MTIVIFFTQDHHGAELMQNGKQLLRGSPASGDLTLTTDRVHSDDPIVKADREKADIVKPLKELRIIIEDQEKEIAVEKALADGKPENIVEKIAEGAVKKYLKENTLVDQAFVKDGKKTVSQVVAEVESGLEVVNFKRVSL